MEYWTGEEARYVPQMMNYTYISGESYMDAFVLAAFVFAFISIHMKDDALIHNKE